MTESRGLPAPDTKSATPATAVLADRIFLLDNPRYTQHVPPFLAPAAAGWPWRQREQREGQGHLEAISRPAAGRPGRLSRPGGDG